MATKLTVREIADAKESLGLLSRPIADAYQMLEEHKHLRQKYSDAYRKLHDMIQKLMGSEVTVKG
jgi:hypothetical protein